MDSSNTRRDFLKKTSVAVAGAAMADASLANTEGQQSACAASRPAGSE